MQNQKLTIDEVIVQHQLMQRACEIHGDKRGLFYSEKEYDQIVSMLQELKKYKELEEQGLLVQLPCKEGDIVYKIITQYDNFDDTPYKIVTAVRFDLSMIKDLNKTIFLNKEEATKHGEFLEELEERLNFIAKMKDNWNNNGANAFSAKLISKCKEFALQLNEKPFVCPTACGSIQFEYKKEDGGYLEFEIYEDRTDVFCVDSSGKEQEFVFVGTSELDKMKNMVTLFYKEQVDEEVERER